MPEEIREKAKKKDFRSILAVLILVLLAIMILYSIAVKDKSADATGSSVKDPGGKSDEQTRQVLLKVGTLLFWLTCLAFAATVILKLLDLCTKY